MENAADFPITPKLIREAEEQRKKGANGVAAKLTESALTLKDPNELDAHKQNLALAALRIHGTAGVSLANSSDQAPDVANGLKLAKKMFDLIFENPNLRKAVDVLKKNFEGNPDDFKAEFGRLEAKYLITLSSLTGDASLLNIAAEILNEIAKNSEETTAKTLASYESARIMFKRDKSNEQYDDLSKKYSDAFNSAYKAKNWERSATESAWYVVDSVKSFHPTGAITGLINYGKTVAHDMSNWSIIFRQMFKAITEDKRHRGWSKTTPSDANYIDELKLK
ncbi:MAG: hypothetical protein WA152_01480 [Microgenomates group bacterium]